MSTPQKLVGAGELGILLDVGRTRVKQIAITPSFPEPAARLIGGSVWELADVQQWATNTGRTLDHDALAAHIASRNSDNST